MNEVNPIFMPRATPLPPERTAPSAEDIQVATVRSGDQIDLSQAAQMQAMVKDAARMDIVNDVQNKIAAGRYETPQMIEVVLDSPDLNEDLQS